MTETANDWKLPWGAGCRCAQVRIQITAPPIITMACHCTGCQRMTASAYSLSVAIPSAGFTVTTGEPVIGGLHGRTHHYFCPHCMSWIFTRPEGMDWFVNLRATMLDDPGWARPFVETFTREKLPWATTPAVHSFETVPKIADYEALMAEFAARSPRPGDSASAAP
jgi:hypothetical protein